MKKRSTLRSLCFAKNYQKPSIKVVKLQYSDIICTRVYNTNGNANLKYGGGSGAAVPVGSVEATGMKKIKQIV
jgi:hypothetical protein